MSGVPLGVDPDRGPPTRVPLRHFVVALALLAAGGVVALASVAADVPGSRRSAVHLVLLGWVCVTIMGAMTQFVPVWSGVTLYSRRLAAVQVWPVAVGVLGIAGSLLTGVRIALPISGLLVLAGLWTFVYNTGRTIARVDGVDRTGRHFVAALACFAVVPVLGILLGASLAGLVAIPHVQVLGAHATLAVFGAVLATVLGALVQLVPMFAQTEFDRYDEVLGTIEESSFLLGVAVLAGGRLAGSRPAATVGAALVLVGLAAFAVVLGRHLLAARGERPPMLSRYAVVVASLAVWILGTAPAWLTRPLDPAVRFGPAWALPVLAVGVVGAVVAGTLYHVVPFLVWVDRYSDRLGFEDVPMIDDLYDDRLAVADFWLAVGGGGLLVGWIALDRPILGLVGAVVVLAGAFAFATNLVLVVRRHGRGSIGSILSGEFSLAGGPVVPDGGNGRETGDDDA